MHDTRPPAKPENQVRLDFARRLVVSCPPSLGREIAITGSVARGVADKHSDIELNLWVDSLPETEEWHSWLRDAGASGVQQQLRDADDLHFSWTVCRLHDIWVEVGWAPIDAFDAFITAIAGGNYVDHDRMQMGWTIRKALALRTEGSLERWDALLAVYPSGLAERVIANQTSVWSDPHVPGVRWGLAARGQRMGLALRFTWDMQNLLRVLFAINHEWDHDLKWTDERSFDLAIKPADLSKRIDAMFTLIDLAAAVEINQRLIIETLELARDSGYQVDAALRSVQQGLRDGSRQR